MTRLEELELELEERKDELEEVSEELEKLENDVENFELDPDDYEDEYREVLNADGTVEIGYLTFDKATILEKLDPIAYNCGLNDYVSELDVEDNEEYKQLVDRIDMLEEEIDDINDTIQELEKEIEELGEKDEE